MANRPEHQRSFESPHASHKGISRVVRANKRAEAKQRQANSASDKRRSFWRERGFARQSQCARAVKDAVTEANQLTEAMRERSGLPDWEPVL
jgi:hypothetical protein